MKHCVEVSVLVVLFAACLATAQVPRSRFDPAQAHPAEQQKSFVDWAFRQINPRNIDYGERIEQMRQSVLDNTLRDPSFRGETLLIAALCVLFTFYWWECRTNGSLRVSTTRIVSAYHNELAVARDQIAKLSAEYAQAKRQLDEQTDAASVVKAAVGQREDVATNASKKEVVPAKSGNDQLTVEQVLTENNSLKQQVKTLTTKWQEEQQRNRKLKGE